MPVGIYNFGNTCYLNSSIQMLYNTTKFREFILNSSTKKNMEVIYLFQLFNGLKNSKTTVVPISFVRNFFNNYLKKIPGEKINIQQDSADILNVIFEIINFGTENYVIENNIYQIDKYTEKFLSNKLSLSKWFKTSCYSSYLQYKFYKYNKKKCEKYTIIDRCFRGYLYTRLECLECSNIKCKFEHFFILMLNMEGETIYDCIISLMKPEILKDESKVFCKSCNNNTITKKQTFIYSLPIYLIIQFKKFDNNLKKINKKINIPNNVIEINNIKYELYSVISHFGNSVNSGHYVNYSLYENEWYLCNDVIIKKIDKPDLSDSYILCFQLIN